jgi:P27 family predicted phage terminase small subunit
MKSTQELKITGTYREDRHADRVEGKSPKEIPAAPAHLSKEEAQIFEEVATLMMENESLAELDYNAVEQYSVQLNIFRKAKKELEKNKNGYVVPHTNKAGATNMIPSPWLTILKTSQDALIKLNAKLGLTPVDRNKVAKVQGKDTTDKSLIR